MTKTAIVCDSTCDLGLEYFAKNDVAMVPLKVLIDGTTYLDWTELAPIRFFELLASVKQLPTTSQPSPADFKTVYETLAARGVEGIVSVHLTSSLSGTIQSATIAASEVDVDVRIVDTHLVTQGAGLVVRAAVQARDSGGDVDTVEAAAQRATQETRFLFVLDTLEYLIKGGRAGKATGLAASLLNIKPILTFNDEGIIEPFKKVKGLSKALQLIAEEVATVSAGRQVEVAPVHAVRPDNAKLLMDALDASGVDYVAHPIGEIGSVIGTYAGPGAVGLAFRPLDIA